MKKQTTFNEWAGAKLAKESERFRALAKDFALKVLLHPEHTDHAQTAREHLLRAETFKDAAALISKS